MKSLALCLSIYILMVCSCGDTYEPCQSWNRENPDISSPGIRAYLETNDTTNEIHSIYYPQVHKTIFQRNDWNQNQIIVFYISYQLEPTVAIVNYKNRSSSDQDTIVYSGKPIVLYNDKCKSQYSLVYGDFKIVSHTFESALLENNTLKLRQ